MAVGHRVERARVERNLIRPPRPRRAPPPVERQHRLAEVLDARGSVAAEFGPAAPSSGSASRPRRHCLRGCRRGRPRRWPRAIDPPAGARHTAGRRGRGPNGPPASSPGTGAARPRATAGRRWWRSARPEQKPAVRRLRSMYCATLPCSTKTAIRAPCDRASMPAALLPAKRSRTRRPGCPAPGFANRLCLTRSPRGRVPGPEATSRSPCDACDHPARTAADARSGRSFSAIQSRLRGRAGSACATRASQPRAISFARRSLPG